MQNIKYSDLNSRQKETYNFQKVSGILADYGFATIRLSDDWESADFLAQHIDGKTFLKVQLKGRLTFDRKYIGKNIYICFPYRQGRVSNRRDWYLLNHDAVLEAFLKEEQLSLAENSPWTKTGQYSWPILSLRQIDILKRHNSALHDVTD